MALLPYRNKMRMKFAMKSLVSNVFIFQPL